MQCLWRDCHASWFLFSLVPALPKWPRRRASTVIIPEILVMRRMSHYAVPAMFWMIVCFQSLFILRMMQSLVQCVRTVIKVANLTKNLPDLSSKCVRMSSSPYLHTHNMYVCQYDEPVVSIRISVPRISLQMPHRWKRLRFKGQGDTLDTVGLSSVCTNAPSKCINWCIMRWKWP